MGGNILPNGMKHRSIPKNVEKCFCGGFTKGACAFIQEIFFFFIGALLWGGIYAKQARGRW